MKRQMPYSTPEGYFGQLQQRLGNIPGREHAALPWQKFSPYLALAAVFAAAFILGGILLNKTASSSAGKDELVEYLIDSDLTLAQLEEAVYYYDE